jgi:hypothetical protein
MALVAYDQMERYLSDSRWANAAGYSLAAVVGMLGSLSFLTATISLGLWSAAVLLWRQRTRKSAWRFAMLQAMPITAGIALWFVHVRIMRSAGGPNLGLGPILYETINYAFGMPAGSLAAYVLIPATIVFVVWQVVQMIRADDLRWMFFVGTIGAASGVLILLAGHRPLYPRYFLTNVCFLYLLLAFAMGRMWDAGRLRWIVATLMALWCVGNLVRTVEFLKVGRGDYTDAMVFIVEHTASGRPEVGSVSDERTRLLGGYYTKRFSEDRRPQFVRTRWLVQVRPEWLLFPRSPYDGIDLPSVLMLTPELSYALVKHFPATRLSGSEAGIYRRADLVGPDR